MSQEQSTTGILPANELRPLIRERLEAAEDERLSPRAARSTLSRGRARAEQPCALRTAFMRDRDRIIHTKAFRRLRHKTQVFLAPKGDHYRTRLTHTLEVTQISRTIARCLDLNEDLAEAIALGHDLGHTPFGHVGEEALSDVANSETTGSEATSAQRRVFRHNEQSLRVVDLIEYDGKGLNLSWEVRDGILNHTGADTPATLEGQIVKIADRIAYVNHDIDDAIRAGVLSGSDLPADAIARFGLHQSQRINAMVQDIIVSSMDQDEIHMSPEAWSALLDLRSFMFDHVYTGSAAKDENERAINVLKMLYKHFYEHPSELPLEYTPDDTADRARRVTDYVAGMTDLYAIQTYERLFLPRRWSV